MLTVDQSSELAMIIAWGLRIPAKEKVLSLMKKIKGLLQKAAAYNGQLKPGEASFYSI